MADVFVSYARSTERQAEQLKTEKEDQRTCKQDRRRRHRQTHVKGHSPAFRPGTAGGFLGLAAESSQSRRNAEIHMRHMRQSGDHDKKGE